MNETNTYVEVITPKPGSLQEKMTEDTGSEAAFYQLGVSQATHNQEETTYPPDVDPGEYWEWIWERYKLLKNSEVFLQAPELDELFGLEKQLLQDFLSRSHDYVRLQHLLQKPDSNIPQIINRIRKLRKKLAQEDTLVSGRDNARAATAQARVIRTRGQLNAFLTGWNETEKENRTFCPVPLASEPQPVPKLYHWIRSDSKEKALKQGLLPGFCAQESLATYVYCAYQKDNDWNRELKRSRNHQTGKPAYFVQLEIEANGLETYAWLPFVQVDRVSGESGYQVYWPHVLVSSRLVSLQDIITYHREVDERERAAGLGPISWDGREDPIDPAHEYNEILTDYVPPGKIKAVNAVI